MIDKGWRYAFYALGGGMIVLAGYLLTYNKPMEAVIAIVAAALALIGTRVPDLLKLKVSKDGLAADMR